MASMTQATGLRFLKALLLGPVLIGLFPGAASALIEHRINLSLAGVDSDVASIDNSGGPITSPIAAAIVGTRYDAFSSVGPLGNFGIEGRMTRLGELDAGVAIFSDEFANVSGIAQNATANLTIDGGAFGLVAGASSRLFYSLNLDLKKAGDASSTTIFSTGGTLNAAADGSGNVTFVPFGRDIGAVLSGLLVEIPASSQTVDLGLMMPGQAFELSYAFTLDVDAFGFAEGVFFAFSDPLNVDGVGDFPTVAFRAVGVAEPGALSLFAVALLGLIRARRRGPGGKSAKSRLWSFATLPGARQRRPGSTQIGSFR